MLQIWDFIMAIPPVSRTYLGAATALMLITRLGLVNRFQYYLNWQLVFKEFQIWRIFTAFIYAGPASFNFVWTMLFAYRYLVALEEGSFRGRRAAYVLFFFYSMVFTTFFAFLTPSAYPSASFLMCVVYLWCRRNRSQRVNFMGWIVVTDYLPWIMFGMTVILGNSYMADGIGILCGHTYYFLEDVFPRQPGGWRILKTPRWLKCIFDERYPVSEDERRDDMAVGRD
ncbi:unnamed protein product, partial [Mesorhabditis spiculigera]